MKARRISSKGCLGRVWSDDLELDSRVPRTAASILCMRETAVGTGEDGGLNHK